MYSHFRGSVECTSWQNNNNTNSSICEYLLELSASYPQIARARRRTCQEYGEITLLLLLLLLLVLLFGFFISSIQSSTIRTYSHLCSFYSLAVVNGFQCIFVSLCY